MYTILLINLKYFADLRKDCFKRSFLSQVFDVGTLVGVQSITGVQHLYLVLIVKVNLDVKYKFMSIGYINIAVIFFGFMKLLNYNKENWVHSYGTKIILDIKSAL